MLDPWIIEEIVRREREERLRNEVRIDLPLDNPAHYHDSNPQPPVAKDEGERGVVTIDI